MEVTTLDIQEIRNEMVDFKPKTHKSFSDWIHSIQNATIVELGRSDPWKEDKTLIQVKRMKEEDLEKMVDVPESEHAYEDCLDVIKLPKPIPTEIFSPAPEFLFIRPDEYELFMHVGGRRRWWILTGNPGISKSWFQWKFILLCYRQDLFDQQWPLKTQAELDEPPTKKHKSEDQTSAVEEKKQARDAQSEQPFIPQLIVRTTAGEKSLLFFVNRSSDVLYIEHSPKHLARFTNANATILWEPGLGMAEVDHQESLARIIATVSPNEQRFHEFQKNATILYMPCPSELQIRLMGQICRSFAKELEWYPTDKEIHERVNKYGPFIRICLLWEEKTILRFEESRKKEIKRICSTENTLHEAMNSSVHIMEPRDFSEFSHRLARYVVHRNNTDCYGGYADNGYRFSSEEVLHVISMEIAKLGIEAVKEHLIAVNRGNTRMEDSLPVYLERIFMLHALSGIQWKCRPMRLYSASCNDDWIPFRVQLNQVQRTITTVQNMLAGVLYYPSDPSFPLVDMYYKDEDGNLIGIQATMAKQHAKPMSTYERFYEKVETSPEHTPLALYYLILPRRIEEYNQSSYSKSKFWRSMESGIESRWMENITFYALVPPDDFGSTTVPH